MLHLLISINNKHMTQTLPQTHSALNKTINGREYNQKLGKFAGVITFCYQIAQTGKLFAQYQYFDHFDLDSLYQL